MEVYYIYNNVTEYEISNAVAVPSKGDKVYIDEVTYTVDEVIWHIVNNNMVYADVYIKL